jgi:hypothetical protein
MRRVEGKGAMLHLVEDLCVLYAKPLPPPDDKHNVCACGVHLMRKRASNPESKNCGRLFLGCAFWKPGRTEGCCNAFRWLDEETPKKSSE